MYVLKLIIILLISILLFPISKKIYENFVNIDPILYTDKAIFNYVNKNILDHSIINKNTQLEKHLNNLFISSKNRLFKQIKYIEGIQWSSWNTNISQFDDISYQLCNYINNKLKSNIIYFSLKRYKENINDNNEYILDYHFVYNNKKLLDAYHICVICIYNLSNNNFNIINIKVNGIISSDKIYMYNTNENNIIYYNAPFNNFSINEELENTYEDITSHDKQVENILYRNLMDKQDTEKCDDYIKNINYENNQNIIKNFLIKDKYKNNKIINCYKNYPYKADFTII